MFILVINLYCSEESNDNNKKAYYLVTTRGRAKRGELLKNYLLGGEILRMYAIKGMVDLWRFYFIIMNFIAFDTVSLSIATMPTENDMAKKVMTETISFFSVFGVYYYLLSYILQSLSFFRTVEVINQQLQLIQYRLTKLPRTCRFSTTSISCQLFICWRYT